MNTASPRIIAVTSGKGGVGKSSFAASLAIALRQTGERVLIVDADLGLADLNLAFSLRPKYTLLDVRDGKIDMNEALTEGPLGVKILAAYPGDYALANLDDQQRALMIDALMPITQNFDTVVIDTGAGIGATSMTFASIATDVMVVATKQPTSLADAYAVMKILSQRFKLSSAWLVPNMVESAQEAEAIYASLESVVRRFLPLKLALAGFVCRDTSVPRGWQRGVPFVADRPDAPASHCVRIIAHTVKQASKTTNTQAAVGGQST
jgi:flagellar biosynthesis protein FlhG